MDAALVNGSYLLERYPGKGGWTYAAIPEVLQDKHSPFGWVKVRGTIDNYPLKQFRLMPMGNGRLFLPVKAEIRKKIGKQAGDWVHLVLFADDSALEIPEELLECLGSFPTELQTFLGYSEGEQKAFVEWIYAAKSEDKKVERIGILLDKLVLKLKFADALPSSGRVG